MFDDELGELLLLLPDEVHQAAGMVAVQMNVPVRTALEHLCRLARDWGEDVLCIAQQVIARQLRFDSVNDA